MKRNSIHAELYVLTLVDEVSSAVFLEPIWTVRGTWSCEWSDLAMRTSPICQTFVSRVHLPCCLPTFSPALIPYPRILDRLKLWPKFTRGTLCEGVCWFRADPIRVEPRESSAEKWLPSCGVGPSRVRCWAGVDNCWTREFSDGHFDQGDRKYQY